MVDKADHASIYDGCRLADGDMIRFQHNDPDRLERVLKKVTEDRAALVIVDGVFSMGGDIAPLPEVAEICKRYQARLFIDVSVSGWSGPSLVFVSFSASSNSGNA